MLGKSVRGGTAPGQSGRNGRPVLALVGWGNSSAFAPSCPRGQMAPGARTSLGATLTLASATSAPAAVSEKHAGILGGAQLVNEEVGRGEVKMLKSHCH